MAWGFPGGARFLAELRRRRVLRVLGFYAISVWIVLQVSNIVFPALLLPVWAMTVLVIAIVASFPLVAILAWVFDITPSGIVRTEPRAEGARYDDELGDVLADRPRMWVDIAIVAVLLAIIGYLLIKPDQLPGAGGEASIAVLPFMDMSAAGDSAYFSNGVTEQLLDNLARIPGLEVVARTSTFAYGDRSQDVRDIAAALGVATVLEGSVRRDGKRVRINAQLIDARTGFHLWSDTYDRTLEDIFAVQDDIARSIAGALRLRLLQADSTDGVRVGTPYVDAYDVYLRGRDVLRNVLVPADVDRAIAHFEQALRIDPRFVLADASLCQAYWQKSEMTRDPALENLALDACSDARARNDRLPEVHHALGEVYRSTGRYDLAEEAFTRALEIDPGYPDALRGLAEVHGRKGESDTAEALFRSVVDLEPDYWRSYATLGWWLWEEGRFEEAIDAFRAGIDRVPSLPQLYGNLGGVYLTLGRRDDAERYLRRSLEIHPTYGAYNNLGTLYFYDKDYVRARDSFLMALDLYPDHYRLRAHLGDACRQIEGEDACVHENYQASIRLAAERLRRDPAATSARTRMALTYARLGDRVNAVEHIDEVLRRQPDDGSALRVAALVALLDDDRIRAVELLERARDHNYPVRLLKDDPDFAVLRDERRFQSLVDGS